jgi:heme-degrading monooxygenase HmoA
MARFTGASATTRRKELSPPAVSSFPCDREMGAVQVADIIFSFLGKGEGHVLARTSSALVSRAKCHEFLSYLQNSVLPHYHNSPGLVSVLLLQRVVVGYVEFLTLSIWRSQEALDGFTANDSSAEDIKNRFAAIPMDPHSYEVVDPAMGIF